MNSELLDEHIGTPPPSTIDVDRIMGRQQRLGRLRWSGAAVVMAVAVVLGAYLVSPGSTAPVAVPSLPPSPSTAASPSPSGLSLEVGDPEAIRRTQEKLRIALEAAMAKAAPKISWIYMPDVPGEPRMPDGHPKMWTSSHPVRFSGRSGITVAGVKGGFYLWVSSAEKCRPGKFCALVHDCDPSQPVCVTTRTPAGLEMVSWTEKWPAPRGKEYHFYGVEIRLRPDFYLKVLAVNYFGGDGVSVSVKTPPMKKAELEALAIDLAEQIY